MPEIVRSYAVIFEPCEEGGYAVTVPALPGCVTQGETLEEARAMAEEVIVLYLESLQADGEPIPEDLEAQPRVEKLEVRVESA